MTKEATDNRQLATGWKGETLVLPAYQQPVGDFTTVRYG